MPLTCSFQKLGGRKDKFGLAMLVNMGPEIGGSSVHVYNFSFPAIINVFQKQFTEALGYIFKIVK